MEFHYFENLGHTLGVEAYFSNGKLPAGHKAIFRVHSAASRKEDTSVTP